MADINRQIIGKAIFAISVVAVTATVGVVGFAQARQGSVQAALDDGYGGTAGQVQAAVDAFHEALGDAANQFKEDLDACLGGNPTASAGLRESSDESLADLSAEAVSPSVLGSEKKLGSVLNASDAKLQAKLTADTAVLAATAPSSQSSCIKQASKDYRAAIKAAQAVFKAAIHDIFH